MRALICGDRDWDDYGAVHCVVEGLKVLADKNNSPLTIIHGAARGADSFAGAAAGKNGDVAVEAFPADWDTHGKAAGPIRNAQMLKVGRPDVVFAFHDALAESKGTKDMVARARAADVPVYVIARAQ